MTLHQSHGYEQPEPCFGRRGYRTPCDHEGRCHSVIACSVLGYCRERAVQNRSEPTNMLRAAWRAEASQRKIEANKERAP